MRSPNWSVISVLYAALTLSTALGQAPSSMSFQGYLTDNTGVPINEPKSITVSLYPSSQGGSVIWTRTYPTVDINKGVFQIELENGTPPFVEVSFLDSLFLQIEVESEVLNPLTELQPSPNTRGFSLPIAAKVDLSDFSTSSAVDVEDTSTSGYGYALSGKTSSQYGAGVRGEAIKATGSARGVYGSSDASGGSGVHGRAFSATGINYGVHGESSSSDGRGVKGEAHASSGNTYGVWGESSSSSGSGVYGRASASTGSTYGVFGASTSSSGKGVYARATSDYGTTYGVHAKTDSPDGWGGYFDGGKGTFSLGADNNLPDIVLGGSSNDTDDGIIGTDPDYDSSDLWLYTNDALIIRLDYDGDGEDADFEIRNSSNVNIFNVDESGEVRVNNTIVHASDRDQKSNVVPVDTKIVLEELADLPISRWRYTGETVSHIGPMAQDFYAAFKVGSDDRHIATVDADGVALAAIQELYQMVRELQSENERLREAVEKMR